MSDRIPLIAGNWKMNLNHLESAGLIKAIRDSIQDLEGVDVLVAPPFTALTMVRGVIGSAKILLAAQNMNWETKGAFTGEISAAMLLEAGLSFLGLGGMPPQPSWGQMAGALKDFIFINPWPVVFPSVSLFLAVFSINLIGDWLQDRLNPEIVR